MKRSTSTSFLMILLLFSALLMIKPKQTYSASERRRLAQMPELTLEKILDKSFMQEVEDYLLDHFPFREKLRRMKAYYAYDILQQKENNGIYFSKGYAGKLEYPLNEPSVNKAADKMLSLQEQYFPDAKVYYSIIPDKNYFLTEEGGLPAMDYTRLEEIMKQKLTSMSYIDIKGALSIEDYYRTDTHWRQECLTDVVKQLGNEMGFVTDMTRMSYHTVYPFYGVYYGQSALPLSAEKLNYLINDTINAATVWNMETNTVDPIYRLDKIESEESFDKYDVFLGGAAPVQSITSPLAQTDRKLIIFRDSYTSSLAPMLTEVYHEIILIDTRYIASSLLGEYVDFSNAEVLFLYNTVLLNHSSMLK